MGTILIVLLKLIQAKFEIQNWVAWPPRNKSEGLGPCDPRVPLPPKLSGLERGCTLYIERYG